jgi:hypothetical protein
VKCDRTLAWNFGILTLRVSGSREGSVLEIKSFKLLVHEIPRRGIFDTLIFRGSGNRGDRDFGIENRELPVLEVPKRHQSCIPWDIEPFRHSEFQSSGDHKERGTIVGSFTEVPKSRI